MALGLDPQATCEVVYEGVKLTGRYMTIGQRLRLGQAREKVMTCTSDEAAVDAIVAALQTGGITAIDGKPLSADVIADTFTLRESVALLYQLPGLVSDLEDSLKKALPSPSQSAPATSAQTVSASAGQ